jgi:hypothetical protein
MRLGVEGTVKIYDQGLQMAPSVTLNDHGVAKPLNMARTIMSSFPVAMCILLLAK